MTRAATPVPKHFIFALEDGTWVVQRGMDRVQELLTGKERPYSGLDNIYPIEDSTLEWLVEEGIVEQYDDSYVWLMDNPTDDYGVVSISRERLLGSALYHYVWTDLDPQYLPHIIEQFMLHELAGNYTAALRLGHVVILESNEEPFLLLGDAEHAHTLIAPILQKLPMPIQTHVETIRFSINHIPFAWRTPAIDPMNPAELIRKLEPKIKPRTVVCVDDEPETHEIVGNVMKELGVEIISAYTGKDAMTLIEDTDPSMILTDLTLPDMHGYEIVAFVRQNPELMNIPIIIISALSSETDRLFAIYVANARDYIVKPLAPEEIRRRVWRVLNLY